MSEKITVEYQNVREKAREMSDNAKELWDKWEKHKRGYFHFDILKCIFPKLVKVMLVTSFECWCPK